MSAREQRVPSNCRHEPAYPGLYGAVITTLADPNLVAHGIVYGCDIQEPHAIAKCGAFENRRWLHCYRNESLDSPECDFRCMLATNGRTDPDTVRALCKSLEQHAREEANDERRRRFENGTLATEWPFP